jgi:hypothetical protein
MTRRVSRNNTFTSGVNPSGFFRASVVAVNDNLLSVKIPRLGGENIYEDVPFTGLTPDVGDWVWATFIEGNSGLPIVVVGASDTTGDPSEADITEVIAGLGLSGGGDTGSVTVDFEPSELTTVELSYDDKIVISDNSDSGEPKLVSMSDVVVVSNGDGGGEPIGHANKADSVISFDYSTRVFTIAPVGASYEVWCKGKKFVKTSSETVTIGSSSDLYYISFDADGVLQATTTYFQWDSETPTAYIHYNSGAPSKYMLFDERHGIVLDWQTHEYLHRTRGAAIASGFDASNFDVSTKDGSTDDQAYIDIADGTFFDEDLQVDIVHSNTPTANTWEQDLQGPAQIPVFYHSGTTGWTYDAPTNFPLKYGGTPLPTYNLNSGGTWSTPEITSNNYGISWIVATNQLNYPVIAIMGQDFYTNLGDAEAVTWDSMNLDDLPVVELRVLYKVIYRAAGSNTPGAYFVEVDDYRRALSSAASTAAAVVDHGNLTGLGDDDHPQYLTEARGDALYAAVDTSPTITLSGDASGSVTLTNLGSATLSVSVANDSHTHPYLSNNTSTDWTSGQFSFRSADVLESASGDQATLEVFQDNAGRDAFMQFHVAGDFAAYFGLKGDINDFAVGGWSMGGTYYRVWHAGNDGSGSGLDADLLDGLQLHTGRNNEANKVVRTDGDGYIQAGWINTPSGATTSTISRIYASNDDYVRYVTPATFRSQVTDGVYAASSHSHSYLPLSGGTVTGNLLVNGYIQTARTGGDPGLLVGDDAWIGDTDAANTIAFYGNTNNDRCVLQFGRYSGASIAGYSGSMDILSRFFVPNLLTTTGNNTLRYDSNSSEMLKFTSLRDKKDDITSIGGILDYLNEESPLHLLNPVIFHEKDQVLDTGEVFNSTRGEYVYGFIAEEVHEVLPESTFSDAEGNLVSYSNDSIVALLVAEVQRLTVLVHELYVQSNPDWAAPQSRPAERSDAEKAIYDAKATELATAVESQEEAPTE